MLMMLWSFLRFRAMLIILAVWSRIYSLATASSANESDCLALLDFKHQISDDPQGALSSWNASLHYCQWHGVTCSPHHHHRVTILDLEFKNLKGTLSPHIGNLSFLTTIRLTMNNFHGPIPQEIDRLSHLRVLFLNKNSFNGLIPANLSHCSNLRVICLMYNKLSGGIPTELTSLSKLTALYLAKNELNGSIPSSLGNLSSLVHLSLRGNFFTGSIPDGICRFRNLKSFHIPGNLLTGMIPSCLYNLSHVTLFSVTDNQLEGALPPDIGHTLPNLQKLHVGINKLRGLIPMSLSNASRLQVIDLDLNQFTGEVSFDLGKLQGLKTLLLHSNQLGSASGDDLNFITYLINCSNLESLSIANNQLKGSMPNSIANLSGQITLLELGSNQIYGTIPAGIEKFVNLEELDFHHNHLTGEIHEFIGKFPKLHRLYLDGNQFSGKIPDWFDNLTSLEILSLSGNEFYGSIPTSLHKCRSLLVLDLSNNKLNGTIPKKVLGLSFPMYALNLSYNDLSGSLPSEIGNLTNLVELDVSGNKFSGPIPTMLGKCTTLQHLAMEDNTFEGAIPQALSTLKGIQYLGLSRNKFSGEIPRYLVNFTSLTYLNLSYNELEGPVPEDGIFANASVISIVGNSKLCGGFAGLNLPPCNIQTLKKGKKSLILKVVVPLMVVSFSLVLSLWFFLMLYCRRMSKEKLASSSLFSHQYPRISYAELLKATNSFSTDYLIGAGSYGSVYKGILDQENTIIAVKVLNLEHRGASKSFLSECNALRNLRHRNLLKFITSCSSLDFQGNDFKAIVFEFMPSGSLEEWLHLKTDEKHDKRNLSFIQRLNIVIDVAFALDYLHHHCQPTIVHCDLKPSNVLLDDDMTAHVADFGLAKIFSGSSYNSSQNEGSSLAVKGSIGYVPPEYGLGGEVSTHGDVYSYGILLLEIFTGKRPTDGMFQNGRNLHSFAKMAALPEQLMKIADPGMVLGGSDKDIDVTNQSDSQVRMLECLVLVIRLGVACSAESPKERMNMGEVLTDLYRIRDHHQGVRIHLE